MVDRNRGFDQPGFNLHKSLTYNPKGNGHYITPNIRGSTRRERFTNSSFEMPSQQPSLKRSFTTDPYTEHDAYGSGNWRDQQRSYTADNYTRPYTADNYTRPFAAENYPRSYAAEDYTSQETRGSGSWMDQNQRSFAAEDYIGQETLGSGSWMDRNQRSYAAENFIGQETHSSESWMDQNQGYDYDYFPQQNEPGEVLEHTSRNLAKRQRIEEPSSTLYLRGMSRNTDANDLTLYFENFGTIADVQCESKHKVKKGTLKGHVTFTEPSMVENACMPVKHFINNVLITVSTFPDFRDAEMKKLETKKVIKLFIRGFEVGTPEDILHQYFAHFGDVSKVCIDRFNLKMDNGVCVPAEIGRVFYTSMFMDMDLLMKERHFIGRNRLELSDAAFRKHNTSIGTFYDRDVKKKERREGRAKEILAGRLNNGAGVSLRSFNKATGRCKTFRRDPHSVCVFCRGLGLGSFTPCYNSPECNRCNKVRPEARATLKEDWIAQSKNIEHRCYWNMAPIDNFLEAENLTADTYDCPMCLMTLSRSKEEMKFHLISDKHRRSAEIRHEVMMKMNMRLHNERLRLEESYIISELPMKFCFICFMTFTTESTKPHEQSDFHKVFSQLKVRPCDLCKVQYTPKTALTHSYTEQHLRNKWHDMILKGDADVSNTLRSHNVTGIIGADLIRDQGVGYCEACGVFFSSEKDGSLFTHCKTKEHFENFKLVLKGERDAIKVPDKLVDNMKEQLYYFV